MFWRKLKQFEKDFYELKAEFDREKMYKVGNNYTEKFHLKQSIHSLEVKIKELEFKNARHEIDISNLEHPQKYNGAVLYKDKIHTVLSSHIKNVLESKEYYIKSKYERRYVLLFFEKDNSITQIFDVPESEISQAQ